MRKTVKSISKLERIEIIMNLKEYFAYKIDDKYREDFRIENSLSNLKRGRHLAVVILFIEVCLMTISFLSYRFSWSNPWEVNYLDNYYIIMYLMLTLLLAAFFVLSLKMEQLCLQKRIRGTTIEYFILACVVIIMTWGAVLSLLDQLSYGSVTAYMINIILASVTFLIEAPLLLGSIFVSMLVFSVGLPSFQFSANIVMGHYINLSIFILLSYIISRTLYINNIKNYVNWRIIEEKNELLADMNQKLVKEIKMRREAQNQMEIVNQQLIDLSLVDVLTGIPNRRRLESFLEFEWKRAIRQNSSISLIMIDIDFFKAYNDNYGHVAGDECVIAVAHALDSCRKRSTDFLARFGGEEFLFIALNSDEEGTKILAENIRKSVEELQIIHEYSSAAPYVTVSLGTTVIKPGPDGRYTRAIELADRALYNAKQSGRNCVRSFPAR